MMSRLNGPELMTLYWEWHKGENILTWSVLLLSLGLYVTLTVYGFIPSKDIFITGRHNSTRVNVKAGSACFADLEHQNLMLTSGLLSWSSQRGMLSYTVVIYDIENYAFSGERETEKCREQEKKSVNRCKKARELWLVSVLQ